MSQTMITNMSELALCILKQNKAQGFPQIHDHDFSACDETNLEMVYKYEVHN